MELTPLHTGPDASSTTASPSGLPKDWMEQTIGQFCSVKTGPFGTLLKASEYTEIDGVPVISVGEVREGYFRVTEHTPLVPERVQKRLPQYLLQAGDVVFGRKGAVERSALVRTHQAGWFLGSDGIAVRPTGGHCPEYVAAQFQSFRVRQWLALNSTGTTMASMNQSVLSRVSIPFPPTFDEERSISEALADADALISSLEQLLTKKRQIKQGTIQELLTGKRRLPGFSGEWELKRIGEIAELMKGSGLSRDLMTSTGSRKCILYGELFTTYGQVILDVVGRTNSSDGATSISGDVLVPGSTTTDGIDLATASALLESGVALGGDINIVRPKAIDSLDSRFLANYLTHVKKREIAERAQGTTIVHLYGRDLSDLWVHQPNVVEQVAISDVLFDMEAEITGLESRLTKARALKQAMAQALLTGRIRLVEPTA